MKLNAGFVFFVSAFLSTALGYKTGAPSSECKTMTPGHKGTTPQKTPSPYTLIFSKKKIDPGEKISIRIQGDKNEKEILRGFMLQGLHNDNPIGKFTNSLSVKLLDCGTGKQNAVTHSSVSDRTGISVFWTAPTNISAPTIVKFATTIARDYKIYWVKQVLGNVTISPLKN